MEILSTEFAENVNIFYIELIKNSYSNQPKVDFATFFENVAFLFFHLGQRIIMKNKNASFAFQSFKNVFINNT